MADFAKERVLEVGVIKGLEIHLSFFEYFEGYIIIGGIVMCQLYLTLPANAYLLLYFEPVLEFVRWLVVRTDVWEGEFILICVIRVLKAWSISGSDSSWYSHISFLNVRKVYINIIIVYFD